MQRAESSASRFQTPNFPKYYATEQESLANATEFRRHVEDVVRGNQPQLRHVSVAVSEQTLTIQLENQNRSARLICRSVRRRRDQRRLEIQRVQRERRAEWQRYRASSVAYLQRHIQESNTVALLREPPTPGMQVSGHLREAIQKKQ